MNTEQLEEFDAAMQAVLSKDGKPLLPLLPVRADRFACMDARPLTYYVLGHYEDAIFALADAVEFDLRIERQSLCGEEGYRVICLYPSSHILVECFDTREAALLACAKALAEWERTNG